MLARTQIGFLVISIIIGLNILADVGMMFSNGSITNTSIIYGTLGVLGGIFTLSMSVAGIIYHTRDISKIYIINIVIIACLSAIVYLASTAYEFYIVRIAAYYMLACFISKLVIIVISIRIMLLQQSTERRLLIDTTEYTLIINKL